MDIQLEQQRVYRQEAQELLSELESALLELEDIPDNEDLISRVFRAMHTIKGSGAMFGFDAIAAFTHELETVFDLVRNGKMTVSTPLINLTLQAGDIIAEMLTASETGASVDPLKTEAILSALEGLLPAGSPEAGPAPDAQVQASAPLPAASPVTYRIRFKPPPDIFAYGTNPVLLLDELAQLGECHIVAHRDAIPLLSDLEPESCHVFWDIILTTDKGMDAIWDVFIFVSDTSQISIRVIDDDDTENTAAEYKKLGEILVERGDLSDAEVNGIMFGRKRIGELLTDAGIVSPDAVESALMEQEHVKKIRQNRLESEPAASSLRVDSEKLDILVDLVGELVTVQARLSRQAATDQDGDLVKIAEEVERLVSELRDNTMGIRMRPIGATFAKFKRLVRDLSATLGKEILLTTEGGETELDKTVLEQLNDPLVHIIRNSIDHGIESPEERARAGKPRHGTVRLSAAHMGANVVIKIADDGAGIDAQAVRKSAVAKGLILPDAALSDKELFELIFMPGFSTAKTVTGVSGRGVGMDVVKKSIEALRGTLDVASQKGARTVITLVLPLTLAIIEGFMVTLDEAHYIFPLSAVEECVEIPAKAMEDVRRRNMLNIRGCVVPYLSLREVFGITGTPPPTERIVVIKSGDDRVGFGVDGVIGQHQTVIKSLGKMYRNIKGVSGATILGDGTVALILDVPHLVNNMEDGAGR